jgi:acyl-coenzyme A synthetase/AMP-(fatty) acid ligase
VEFVDALPVSDYGKVMRREIRERYWKGYETRVGGGGPKSVKLNEEQK